MRESIDIYEPGLTLEESEARERGRIQRAVAEAREMSCPRCTAPHPAVVLWGLQADPQRFAQPGELYLAGCEITSAARWRCRTCHCMWSE